MSKKICQTESLFDPFAGHASVPPPQPQLTEGESEGQTSHYVPPNFDSIREAMAGFGGNQVQVAESINEENGQNVIVVSSSGIANRAGSLFSQQGQDMWSGNLEAWGEVAGLVAVYVGLYGFLLYVAFRVVQRQTQDEEDPDLPGRWTIYIGLAIFAGCTLIEGCLKNFSAQQDNKVGNQLHTIFGKFLALLKHDGI